MIQFCMFLYVVNMFRYMHEKNGVICDAIVRVISTQNFCCFAQELRVWDTFEGMSTFHVDFHKGWNAAILHLIKTQM